MVPRLPKGVLVKIKDAKFRLLGDIKDLYVGKNCKITRDPWPFFDVKGGGIVLCDNVTISSGVSIHTHTHQFHLANWRDLDEVRPNEPTVIGDNVFIGMNAMIMHGCKSIGECSVVSAGAVVTKDVPAYEIWAGNPARKIKDVWRSYPVLAT